MDGIDDFQLRKKLRLVMMNMLARREHSAAELRQKSRPYISHSAEGDIVDAVITQLQLDGLQSDTRFSEVYINKRAEQLYGPERIRSELFHKGIDRQLIDGQMADCPVDWQWSLQLLIDKKLPTNGEVDEKKRHKLMAYLARRGFCEHDIRRLLD